MKITISEIVNMLVNGSGGDCRMLAKDIQQYGIQLDYVPMTDDEKGELQLVLIDPNEPWAYESMVEQTVLARIGAVPNEIDNAEILGLTTKNLESLLDDSTTPALDQAKVELTAPTGADELHWSGTQAEYDAIPVKDPSTWYWVVDPTAVPQGISDETFQRLMQGLQNNRNP
jgi:hypothetical protein